MGGSSAICAERRRPNISSAIAKNGQCAVPSRTFYAASQALGRHWTACGLAGTQHGAAENRRIHDPDGSVLGARCGVRMGPVTVGLRRLVAPAVSRAQLPHIDLILLSHAHFDHFDLATLRSLERAGNGGGDGEVHQRSAARAALSERAGSGMGRARARGSALDPGHSGETLGRADALRRASRL